MTAPFVHCLGLVHIYKANGLEVVALQGLDLTVAQGEAIAIVGRSGSGKTTLMNILAGIEAPSAGRARVGDWDLTTLSEPGRDTYRREVVGYVWQQAQRSLAPELFALDNVQLSLLGAGHPLRTRRERALELLNRLGLRYRLHNYPAQLSAGEQQRLALAVALANRPHLLLADEPTGQLDSRTAGQILEDLRRLQREQGTTVIMVTHDRQVERYAERVIRIRDGRTSTETRWVDRAGEAQPEEMLIIDRAGRLQLPAPYVEALGLRDRVRVRLEPDRVVIEPIERDWPSPEGEPPGA